MDQAKLLELLRYEPETGKLFWKERVMPKRRGSASWNARYAGKEAGSLTAAGYLSVVVLGKTRLVHRVIWVMVTGREPSAIDHINGCRADNKWANLREASSSENARNQGERRDLPLGIYSRRDGLPGFVATIGYRLNGKKVNHHLGSFETLGQAVDARKAAERKFGFHPNHGRSTNA